MESKLKLKDDPIRILHVIGSMNRGGAQSFIMNIYRKIDRSRIQFDFVVHTAEKCAFDNEIISLGGKIYHCPKYEGKNHFRYSYWWKAFFKAHPENQIVHGHIRSTATIYMAIAKKYGLTTISHSHSTSSGKGVQAVVKNIMQYPIRYIADYLFSCSKTAGEWLFGTKACQSSKFYILNNSINAQEFTFNNKVRNEKRKEFNLEKRFVLGHIGRFSSEKNHLGLIEIFKEVHSKQKKSTLLLVGDGKLRSVIEEKVKNMGLINNVIFTGSRSDIPQLLQAMDVFVFPSLWEGLGIAVIEAQASGLKCIVSDKVPQEAYITDLIEAVALEESPKNWASKILSYSDGYERRNMLDAIINNKYDTNYTSKWIENFYLRVVDK